MSLMLQENWALDTVTVITTGGSVESDDGLGEEDFIGEYGDGADGSRADVRVWVSVKVERGAAAGGA